MSQLTRSQLVLFFPGLLGELKLYLIKHNSVIYGFGYNTTATVFSLERKILKTLRPNILISGFKLCSGDIRKSGIVRSPYSLRRGARGHLDLLWSVRLFVLPSVRSRNVSFCNTWASAHPLVLPVTKGQFLQHAEKKAFSVKKS